MIPLAKPDIGKKEINYVLKAVKSGWVSSLGEFVERFEKEFAVYCGRKYSVSVSSGTAALHLALTALGIQEGEEVIVPNFTFAAVANAVTYPGARVVPVDIESDTWNIDPRKIEDKISNKTKAIIVVHTYGHPCDIDSILQIARKYKLKVIEDAAEAHGAEYKGKKVGAFGEISIFSFYGNKTITTGEGGICLTNDRRLYEKMLLLRDHGMRKEKKYWHEVIGFNYRMTNLEAALGCAQLERISEFLRKKQQNAKLYSKYLRELSWITLPVEKPYAKNSYWVFAVLINEKSKILRNEIIKKLKKEGIESRVFFYPISDLPPYCKEVDQRNLDISKDIAYRGIILPSASSLSKKDIRYICTTLKRL